MYLPPSTAQDDHAFWTTFCSSLYSPARSSFFLGTFCFSLQVLFIVHRAERPFCTYGHRRCSQQFVICCFCYRYLEAVTASPSLLRNPTKMRLRYRHTLNCTRTFLHAPLRVGTACEPTHETREGVVIDLRTQPHQSGYLLHMNTSTVLCQL